MSNKVLLKKSSVASKVPLVTDLDYGELALNYTDEKLYFKNASNAIKSFKVTPSTLTIGTGLSGTSYNGSSAVTITIDSTVATKSYVDSVVGISGSQRTTTTVIPTVGQTVFNITYEPGYIDVFYNGVKLILADDFVATNGTSVTLTNATITGDVVEFVTYLNIALTDTYTKSQADAKFATIASPTFTGTVSGITKSMVGLSNVDNTADANKPISTATQTILDLKAPLDSPTFTGTVSGITKSMVGLSNVDNTTDAGKPVSTATQTALDLKAPLASPTFTGTVTLPTSLLNVTTSSYPTVRPTLNLDFANSKVLDPRITFVRNSTATYYDGQTSALAEQNLMLQSQGAFSNTTYYLSTSGATITDNNVTAPDGTLTASTFNATAQFSSIRTVFLFPAGTHTFSIYAYRTSGTNLIYVYTNGGTLLGSYSPTSTWARYSITFTLATSEAVYIVQDRATSGFTPIYIWGAQLERRSSVTVYTPTTTSAITNYIPQLMTAPAGVARFDCDPITRNSLGLLIEESRTNLLTYSSIFSSALWLTFGTATKTADTVVAPDGTITGCIVSGATSIAYQTNNLSRLYSLLSPSTVYTFSLWIKSMGTATSASVSIRDNTSGANTIVVATINSTWQRVSVTATTSASTTSCYVQVGAASADIAIWGAQLEAGAFATSYIPTVASTVTRAADQASMTGTNFSSWYNQAQGSFYCEGDFNQTNPPSASMFLEGGASDGTSALVSISTVGTSNMRFIVRNTTTNSTGDRQIPYTFVVNALIKTAILYNGLSGLTCALNGVSYTGTAPVAASSIPDRIFIGFRGAYGSSFYLNGHIRKLSYYPVALSSSNLVALTS